MFLIYSVSYVVVKPTKTRADIMEQLDGMFYPSIMSFFFICNLNHIQTVYYLSKDQVSQNQEAPGNLLKQVLTNHSLLQCESLLAHFSVNML